MSNHQENKKVKFQEDFVKMETSPATVGPVIYYHPLVPVILVANNRWL